jgi:FkbM family methyltransferase
MLLRRIQSHARTAATFGVRNWSSIVRGGRLRTPHAAHPLEFRRDTSDLSVYRQVFLGLEYACVPNDEPAFIIDCGANVGYASAYFLTRFPRAELIAIEPDPGNFAVLTRNLAPYGRRARAIHGAVWSHATRLSMAAPDYRGGEEWARQVCEGGDEVAAYGVADLLRIAGWERADLLKMDIEGAEAVVFANNTDAWIDRVTAMVIELHDDTVFGPATEIVNGATAGFTAQRSGELTVYRRAEFER